MLAALAALVLLTGCGPSRPRCLPVSGQVLLDGKPLRAGFVRVVPASGRMAIGKINSDGRFQLTTFEPGDGCILGTHPVEIIAAQNIADEISKHPIAVQPVVPQKYGSVETSGLSITINGRNDSWTIRLTSDSAKP